MRLIADMANAKGCTCVRDIKGVDFYYDTSASDDYGKFSFPECVDCGDSIHDNTHHIRLPEKPQPRQHCSSCACKIERCIKCEAPLSWWKSVKHTCPECICPSKDVFIRCYDCGIEYHYNDGMPSHRKTRDGKILKGWGKDSDGNAMANGNRICPNYDCIMITADQICNCHIMNSEERKKFVSTYYDRKTGKTVNKIEGKAYDFYNLTKKEQKKVWENFYGRSLEESK